eukprot:CAMPEP_0119351880 /NCGR_PEP_ID=MMETSP1334-20130426/1163_1 /TAXON_ID=127549 /ORGANISM="Calcidiscus leptoporus, Strain RCC1130" /LENGTH=62 /DNA_ID=CAMNT_0007364775 /DNA_START=64 /DNA_END=252 /DNA_ORIENTATION=-
MYFMSVTLPTCHELRLLLKFEQSLNMYDMDVTSPTCHELRSPLKLEQPEKSLCMLVVLETSQ